MATGIIRVPATKGQSLEKELDFSAGLATIQGRHCSIEAGHDGIYRMRGSSMIKLNERQAKPTGEIAKADDGGNEVPVSVARYRRTPP